jgi:hypothetical protein
MGAMCEPAQVVTAKKMFVPDRKGLCLIAWGEAHGAVEIFYRSGYSPATTPTRAPGLPIPFMEDI